MNKKYRIGKRFRRLLNACILGELLVMLMFYYLYSYLFQDVAPGLMGTPLMAIFVGLTLLVVWGTVKFFEWYNETYWVEVTEEGLRMSRGKTVRFYPWKDFKKAKVNNFMARTTMALSFDTASGELVLDTNLDDVEGLALTVLRRIEGTAEFTPDVLDRIKMFEVMK